MEVTLQGFGWFLKSNVRVGLNATTTTDAVVAVANVAEEVVVAVDVPVVDVERTERQFNVDSAAMGALPIEGRQTFQSAWQLLPGVLGAAAHASSACRSRRPGRPRARHPAQIDDVIGGLDDVHVVFDEEHRVSGVHELIQRHEQALDVRQVQPGRRLVEDVNGVLRALELAQLGRDLDSLRLAARERRGRLAERQVAEAEVVQDLDLPGQRRLGSRKTRRLPPPTCSTRRRWSCRGP